LAGFEVEGGKTDLGESWQEKVDFFRKAVTGIIGGPPSFTG
jgi:hypothetical protein